MGKHPGIKVALKIILVVAFLALVFYAIANIATKTAVSIFILGILTSVIAIYSAFNNEEFNGRIAYHFMALMPAGIGVAVTVIGAVCFFKNDSSLQFIGGLFGKGFLGLFVYAGAFVILSRIIYKLAKKRNCTAQVNAVCVDLREKPYQHGDDVNDKIACAGVFNYYFDGQDYTITEETYSTDHPKIDEEYTLLINPKAPDDLYLPDRKADLWSYIIGGIFIAVGIGLIIFLR